MSQFSPAAIPYGTDPQGGTTEKATDVNPLIVRATPYGLSTFGQTLVAAPRSFLDQINFYYLDPTVWGTDVSGGGTVAYVTNQSSLRIAVGATNGDRARLRTHTYFRYQAGKMQSILVAGYASDTGQTNQTRRWGYFEDNDGLFFQLSDTTLSVVRRTFTSGSVVDNVTNQSTWNRDTLDGSGISGVTLDVTKANIYEIRFQWLGVGIVQFFVNGILVHVLDNPNTLIVPYMRTAMLPVQVEVINTGTSSAGDFTMICASVRSDGGEAPPEYSFTQFNSVDVTVSTTERPILSIRPKSTFQSLINRMLIIPMHLQISTEGGRAGFRVVLNGALTGSSFSSADADSGVEFDIAATSMTGGTTIERGFLPNSDDAVEEDLSRWFHELGRTIRRNAFNTSGDTLTILGVNEIGGTSAMRAAVAWREIR